MHLSLDTICSLRAELEHFYQSFSGYLSLIDRPDKLPGLLHGENGISNCSFLLLWNKFA